LKWTPRQLDPSLSAIKLIDRLCLESKLVFITTKLINKISEIYFRIILFQIFFLALWKAVILTTCLERPKYFCYVVSRYPPAILLVSYWYPVISYWYPVISYWYPTGILLVSYWNPVGILLVSYWYPTGILLVSYWNPVGILLVSCLYLTGILLVSYWYPTGILLTPVPYLWTKPTLLPNFARTAYSGVCP
jgi:hypothetical protein